MYAEMSGLGATKLMPRPAPTNPEEFSQRSLRHGEWCTLPANPSKCDRTLEKYAELKFPMVYDSSNSVINAARDLADMGRRRKCFSDEERAKAPLFLDPKSKKAVTSSLPARAARNRH